jgi:hypothetical protein
MRINTFPLPEMDTRDPPSSFRAQSDGPPHPLLLPLLV